MNWANVRRLHHAHDRFQFVLAVQPTTTRISYKPCSFRLCMPGTNHDDQSFQKLARSPSTRIVFQKDYSGDRAEKFASSMRTRVNQTWNGKCFRLHGTQGRSVVSTRSFSGRFGCTTDHLHCACQEQIVRLYSIDRFPSSRFRGAFVWTKRGTKLCIFINMASSLTDSSAK